MAKTPRLSLTRDVFLGSLAGLAAFLRLPLSETALMLLLLRKLDAIVGLDFVPELVTVTVVAAADGLIFRIDTTPLLDVVSDFSGALTDVVVTTVFFDLSGSVADEKDAADGGSALRVDVVSETDRERTTPGSVAALVDGVFSWARCNLLPN